jgi:hypothetical protein
MQTWDADAALDALLAEAGQRPPADEERVFGAAWSRVRAEMDCVSLSAEDGLQQRRIDLLFDREKAARRRRRVVRLASAALAVAVAGGGTAAAAELLSTRTGQHTSGWEVGAGGSGELLNEGGSDRQQVFDQATADIPFAPGHEAQRTWALQFFPADDHSLVSVSHLRSWVATTAVCTWADAWLAADTDGDEAARAAAAQTLAASMTWEPVRTFDRDHGEPDPADSGSTETYFGWLRPLATAAADGDREGVLNQVEVAGAHACSPEAMPFLDAGVR